MLVPLEKPTRDVHFANDRAISEMKRREQTLRQKTAALSSELKKVVSAGAELRKLSEDAYNFALETMKSSGRAKDEETYNFASRMLTKFSAFEGVGRHASNSAQGDIESIAYNTK